MQTSPIFVQNNQYKTTSSNPKGVIHLPCACFVQSRAILTLVFWVLFIVEMAGILILPQEQFICSTPYDFNLDPSQNS